jgi:hypothetical protein
VKINELKKRGFQKSGSIIEIEPTAYQTKVGFDLEPGLSTDALVYVWVDVTDTNDIVVLYCGRAGKGIKKRMYEHSQGFKGKDSGGSASGKKKHDFLIEEFVKKRKIEVWSKSSISNEDESKFLKEFSEKVNYWLYLNRMV